MVTFFRWCFGWVVSLNKLWICHIHSFHLSIIGSQFSEHFIKSEYSSFVGDCCDQWLIAYFLTPKNIEYLFSLVSVSLAAKIWSIRSLQWLMYYSIDLASFLKDCSCQRSCISHVWETSLNVFFKINPVIKGNGLTNQIFQVSGWDWGINLAFMEQSWLSQSL